MIKEWCFEQIKSNYQRVNNSTQCSEQIISMLWTNQLHALNKSSQASELAGTKQLSELIEVQFFIFNLIFFNFHCDVKVEGPADVTHTSGMPDAERKERQVLSYKFSCLQ